MSTPIPLITFNQQNRALFRIEDFRERADALRDQLVPKLRQILDLSLSRVKQIYQCEPFEGSSQKPSISPDHRKTAKANKEFLAAYAGLVGAQRDGKYISPKLILVLSNDGLRAVLWINKEHEARVFAEIITKYSNEVSGLLRSTTVPAKWAAGDDKEFVNVGALTGLPWGRERSLEGFRHFGICCQPHAYPVNIASIANQLSNDFVYLYPIYKATIDLLHGEKDRFLEMYDHVLRQNGQPEVVTLSEGEWKAAYTRHRHREKTLRDAKIQQEIEGSNPSLKCEVPHCGFSFVERYGQIGAHYAQVHHLQPLHEGERKTSIKELVIVCANCHVMIHRGKENRSLETLIDPEPRID